VSKVLEAATLTIQPIQAALERTHPKVTVGLGESRHPITTQTRRIPRFVTESGERSAIRVEPIQTEIEKAVRAQLEHGRYPRSDIYGSGPVAEKIARKIAQLKPYAQKRLDFVFEDGTPRNHLPSSISS